MKILKKDFENNRNNVNNIKKLEDYKSIQTNNIMSFT